MRNGLLLQFQSVALRGDPSIPGRRPEHAVHVRCWSFVRRAVGLRGEPFSAPTQVLLRFRTLVLKESANEHCPDSEMFGSDRQDQESTKASSSKPLEVRDNSSDANQDKNLVGTMPFVPMFTGMMLSQTGKHSGGEHTDPDQNEIQKCALSYLRRAERCHRCQRLVSFLEVVNDAASSDGHSASTLSSVSSLIVDGLCGCLRHTRKTRREMMQGTMGLQRPHAMSVVQKAGPDFRATKLLATHLNCFDQCSKIVRFQNRWISRNCKRQ